MTPREAFERLTRDGDVILDRLAHWARETPDKTCLHDGEDGGRWSFAQFQDRAERLAAGLAAQGVGPGDRVAVLTRNSRVTALTMFGIWRAGAVFAPVNFNLTGELLAYQLSDAAPKLLITDPSFLGALDAALPDGPPPLVLHRPAPGDHDHDPDAPEGPAGALDLEALHLDAPAPEIAPDGFTPAAIIYTSGTTGPAKGVLLNHRWINQYTFGARELTAPGDVIYCDLPLYHVGGAFHLLGRGVWMGQTVALWDRFSPNRFWDRIAECGASCATLLDVMIPRLMSRAPSPEDADNTLAQVHMQPFNADHQAFARRFGIDFMTVGFGQSESGSVFSGVIDELGEREGVPQGRRRGLSKADYRARAESLGRLVFDGREDLPKGLMGRPSELFDLAVLDENDMPVASGEVGQLCLRPRFPGLLMEGYINKPEATLKTLRNCWFHTGDAIREVEAARRVHVFVDRMGGFFRVRGENVSSFEVESSMARLEGVRAVAAVPVPAADGDEDDIAAFVELEEGARVAEGDLRAHAEAVMPRYMRPTHIRIVEALPVTPTSKVEKYKLKSALLAELEGGAGGRT